MTSTLHAHRTMNGDPMDSPITEQTLIHNTCDFALTCDGGSPSEPQAPTLTDELDMDVPAVLNRAADIIQSEGWYQGWYCYDGKFCSVGAIRTAVGIKYARPEDGHPQWQLVDATCNDDNAWTAAINAEVALETYLEGHYIPRWNDEPDRTPTEVVEAMRSCALIESAKRRHPSWVAD